MLIQFTNRGIFCPRANIYIDPWKPVDKAIITHAHSDHARWGSKHYLSHKDSEFILRYRLGTISLETLSYNQPIQINGVKISLHPAGHITGSAQVRLEHNGEIWVVSGDYKVKPDGYSVPFEPVRCQHFITESTFGLPVYNFPEVNELNIQLNQWTKENATQGFNSVLIGYALGKAQRILSALTTDQPILLHSTIYNTNNALGFDNSPYIKFTQEFKKEQLNPGIVVATGSVIGNPWLKRFDPYRLAFCSGWMQLRGARRRRNADKGFIMSDHADWQGLNEAVLATGAENVYVTHGYKTVYAKWLRENYKLNAYEVETLFEGESIETESSETIGEQTETGQQS
ncbi:MAG: exonuclease of the beta-lactamase fold involved in processing [Bacteroidota bacterium]|nr:exonuclease of the beta-lactamase fold involved in processing [Bacteroidota bacterium]